MHGVLGVCGVWCVEYLMRGVLDAYTFLSLSCMPGIEVPLTVSCQVCRHVLLMASHRTDSAKPSPPQPDTGVMGRVETIQ